MLFTIKKSKNGKPYFSSKILDIISFSHFHMQS